ncbi:MAG TPA: hypothetical protein ENI97_03590 [Gammaproteobacteria bacterium]|nr:hypothetical protein [Gammaproteobacteria bacterium]
MSSQSSFLTWLRHPASMVLIIALVLMLVVMSEQSPRQGDGTTAPPLAPEPASVEAAPAGAPAAPARMGGELPRIVRQLSAPGQSAPAAKKPGSAAAPGRLQAPDLGSLLGRLEDKVKAEPSNMGNRLLLAQTYNELGLGDKALQEARAARQQDPRHARAKLVLAAILSTRDDPAGLQEAAELLQELTSDSQIKQYLVAMYQGDVAIRQGDHDKALRFWQRALDEMPVSDNRRASIEKRVAELSAKASSSVEG